MCDCTGCKFLDRISNDLDEVLEHNRDAQLANTHGETVPLKAALCIALMTKAAEYVIDTALDKEQAKLHAIAASQSFLAECFSLSACRFDN